MPSDTYNWLAKYYDHLFDWHRPFARARRTLVDPLLPSVRSVCDLCCGTGTLAVWFARKRKRTYAVDLSPAMCAAARAKAEAAGLPVTVIEADMRDFLLPEPVDLITSHFDAINHVPRKSDLRKVARGVANSINTGGHFIFDVNTRLAFERVWNLTWFLEKDPVAMVMRSGHKTGTDRAWTDVDWFIRVGANSWRRRREHIEEVCWTEEEIRTTLSRAGFGELETWDAAPFFQDPFTQPGNRTFWRARKL